MATTPSNAVPQTIIYNVNARRSINNEDRLTKQRFKDQQRREEGHTRTITNDDSQCQSDTLRASHTIDGSHTQCARAIKNGDSLSLHRLLCADRTWSIWFHIRSHILSPSLFPDKVLSERLIGQTPGTRFRRSDPRHFEVPKRRRVAIIQRLVDWE